MRSSCGGVASHRANVRELGRSSAQQARQVPERKSAPGTYPDISANAQLGRSTPSLRGTLRGILDTAAAPKDRALLRAPLPGQNDSRRLRRASALTAKKLGQPRPMQPPTSPGQSNATTACQAKLNSLAELASI